MSSGSRRESHHDMDGRLTDVFETRDGLITRIHGIAAPEKLAYVRSRLAAAQDLTEG